MSSDSDANGKPERSAADDGLPQAPPAEPMRPSRGHGLWRLGGLGVAVGGAGSAVVGILLGEDFGTALLTGGIFVVIGLLPSLRR